jgi:hypothetical protein
MRATLDAVNNGPSETRSLADGIRPENSFAAQNQPPTSMVRRDLAGRPLVERKRLLDDVSLMGPAWATNSWYPGDGDTVFTVCVELGHEGVVAKRLDAPTCPVGVPEPG